MTPISCAVPMVHIDFSNSSISFPLLSGFTVLLVVVLSTLVIIWGLIKKLPDLIYKRFEDKFARETELLKIICSQVEPQKIDTYLEIAATCGELNAIALADQQKLSPDERKSQIEKNKSFFILQSRFFLFASDRTIDQYISMIDKDSSSRRFTLNATPSFVSFANFMVSMRKDMHPDTQKEAVDFCTTMGIIPSEMK